MDPLTRRRTLSLLGGAALAPFAVGSAFADASVDQGQLGAVADRLVASGANVHSILVARGDRLLFERYFTGSDEIMNRRVNNATHDAETLHDMKSVSKSVASLVFGIAVDRG